MVATSRNFLLRADLSDGGQASVVEIDLQRPGDAVCRQVWLDPSGSHCLVAASAATGAPETLYVDSAWKKARILSKMKGMALTAVAWWPSLQPSHTTRWVLGRPSKHTSHARSFTVVTGKDGLKPGSVLLPATVCGIQTCCNPTPTCAVLSTQPRLAWH